MCRLAFVSHRPSHISSLNKQSRNNWILHSLPTLSPSRAQDYKGITQYASLRADGRIVATVGGRDITFESPSAYSVYLKRLINPSRKADDGWKTVKYRGRLLEQFKGDLAMKRFGGVQAMVAPKRPKTAAGPPRAVSGTEVANDGRNVVKFRLLSAPEEEGLASGDGGRPRRERRAPSRLAAVFGADDEHALRPLEAFAPGPAGAPGTQPFTLRVSPAAEVLMDFHAHMCMDEVVGLLAGEWDPAARVLTVLRALPVREAPAEDGSTDVEMDPEAEFAAREEAAARWGLRVVGWYHSHPTFPAQPSRIDVYNQAVQQHHHREGGASSVVEGQEGAGRGYAEPYVAAIVGPYDRRLPSNRSELTWFYVDQPADKAPPEDRAPEEAGCVAKAMVVSALCREACFSVPPGISHLLDCPDPALRIPSCASL
jgi:proteasome lid subunit RPN8/RPN11